MAAPTTFLPGTDCACGGVGVAGAAPRGGWPASRPWRRRRSGPFWSRCPLPSQGARELQGRVPGGSPVDERHGASRPSRGRMDCAALAWGEPLAGGASQRLGPAGAAPVDGMLHAPLVGCTFAARLDHRAHETPPRPAMTWRGPAVSQADSASSILVTRSTKDPSAWGFSTFVGTSTRRGRCARSAVEASRVALEWPDRLRPRLKDAGPRSPPAPLARLGWARCLTGSRACVRADPDYTIPSSRARTTSLPRSSTRGPWPVRRCRPAGGAGRCSCRFQALLAAGRIAAGAVQTASPTRPLARWLAGCACGWPRGPTGVALVSHVRVAPTVRVTGQPFDPEGSSPAQEHPPGQTGDTL